MKKWLFIALVALGLAASSAAIWLSGPFVVVAGIAPFEPVWARLALILLVCGGAGLFYGWRLWRSTQAARKLEEGIVAASESGGDAKVLSERMADALKALKASTGKGDYLYSLPWYVIIGPPGAGKTTALVNSGLKFPLAGESGASAVGGTGGTRYCDWWFTEEAVMIDTAGRYTTQDSDAAADRKSWLSFLDLLKRYRQKQPINGVIVAISLEDVMKLTDAELAAHANAIRQRLIEINRELRIDFPVYALFTKADLIAGFDEYFGNFTEARRRAVWGATFQTEDRKKNMVASVPAEFDALTTRLTEELPDRLHEEPDAVSRIALYGFPAQFAMLRERICGFLAQIFEPNRYQASANLRGFYFSSGTQEGTPIDQVLGAMDRSFGGGQRFQHFSGRGKSYFLHDLLKKVIFSETGWVSVDMRAMRISRAIRYGALAAVGVVTVGLLGLWGWSFANNRALLADTEQFVSDYRANAGELLTAATVSDADPMTVLPTLDLIRNNPVGFAQAGQPVPMGETFGLSQRDRLSAASRETYRQALERLLRSRLILRLERQLEATLNDPTAAYAALKAYMMLGGKAPLTDDEYIVAWMMQDWEQNLYPGPQNRAAREALAGHLRAMLALDAGRQPSFELNGLLVDAAQRTLTRLSLADQAYGYLKSLAPAVPIEDFNLAQRAGPEADLVFETVDGSNFDEVTIPALFTYRGFHEHFLAELSSIADELSKEQWVRGEIGAATVSQEQFGQLGPQLLALYSRDFVDTWNAVLANIKLKTLPGDKPDYVPLSVASNIATSPIKALVQAIATETALTREPQVPEPDTPVEGATGVVGDAAAIAAQALAARTSGLGRIGIDLALQKSGARAGETTTTPAQQVPGANVEAQFSAFPVLLEGSPAPIDVLIESLNEVYRNLVVGTLNPSQNQQATSAVQLQLANLSMSASRLPQPLQRMISGAVADLEGDAAGTSLAQLNQELASTVTRLCQQLTSNLYPFEPSSQRDLPMADFARLFAPNGVMDRFFAENLAPLADMSGEEWVWKADTALGRELSNAALREFQRAAEIRDAFFPPNSSTPSVTLTVSHLALHAAAQVALLDINGRIMQTQQVGNVPATFEWPGSAGTGAVQITILPELPGRESNTVIQGPWALMRLIQRGSVSRSGDTLRVQFVIGGRDVAYSIQVGTVFNPFFLPALSEFSCPTGL